MRTFKFKAVSVVISMALALALPFGVMAADGFGDGAAFDAEWDDSNVFDNGWDDPDAFDFNEDQTIESQVGDDFGFFNVDAFVAAEGEAPESSTETPANVENPAGGLAGETNPAYTFYYNVEGHEDFEVWFAGKLYDKAYVLKEIPPTCEEPGLFVMAINVGLDTIACPPIAWKETDTEHYKKPLGHKWEKVITIEGAAPNGCTSDDDCPCVKDVEVTTVEYCPVCKKYKKIDGDKITAVDKNENPTTVTEKRTALGHKFGDPVTVYLNADKTKFDPETAQTGKTWTYEVTYKVCQNTGCNHVDYVIKKASEVVYEAYDNVAKCDVLNKNAVVPPSEALYNDVILTNCTKDGKVKATVTTYKKEGSAFDQGKTLSNDDLKDDNYTIFADPVADEAHQIYTIPAHHTYKLKYTLKDKTLPNADNVKNYVNIVNLEGKVVEPDEETGLYDLNTVVGASKYCIDFEVEVTKVTICENPGYHETKKQIETSEGVAVAKATANSHLYNETFKTKVGAYTKLSELKETVNEDNSVTYKKLTFAELKVLKDAKKNPNFAVTTNIVDCTKAGNTGTATCKCSLCGELIAKTKVTFELTPEKKHSNLMEMTEVVPASCTTEGSYIPVYKCENCGIQTTGDKEIIPKTPHVYDNVSPAAIKVDGDIVVGNTWGKNSDYNVKDVFEEIDTDNAVHVGVAKTANYEYLPGVAITLTRKCTICGQDIPIIKKDIKSLKATVTAVKKEGADGVYCKEGEITFKIEGTPKDGVKSLDSVSEEVTLRYYSSADQYLARYSAHTPSAVVKSNEVEPTETEAGGYDETISCIFCGKVISQRHVTIPALGHTHSMVAVEAKEATCTEDGNIAYYQCEKCGLKYKTEAGELEDQLTDEEVVVPKTGHDINLVEAKDATCVDGHAAYYVCHNCGEIFKDAEGKEPISYDEVKIEATEEHTPADPVPETREGKVFSVVYCSRCGTELSVEPYKPEEVAPLEAPKTFELKANKPLAGYMEFKLSEVEGAEKYRVSYREVGTDPYTRQESVDPIVKVEELERGKIYEFTACAGDVVENVPIKWGARALNKKGNVKYIRRWYETVEQSKIAKKGSVVTLEWTALADASKYVIYIADNKAMKNAKEVDTSNLGISFEGGKIKVSADLTMIPGFEQFPAGTTMKFYVRIRPYTMYGEDLVAGGYSNLRAKTIKF